MLSAPVQSRSKSWVDVVGLEPGTHDLLVQVQVNPAFRPVRQGPVIPELVEITLEPLLTRTYPVNLEVTGEPAVGYQKGPLLVEPSSITVSGAASLVIQIEQVGASIDISGVTETIERNLSLVAVDQQGDPVSGVNITPAEVAVTQPIFLQGGYRNVIVRVETVGQPADGYKLTNITVSPLNVVVFSSDPQLVNDLPGYVETEAVDLTGAVDDIDTYVAITLPEGVTLVGDQFVPILDTMTPEDVRVLVDVSDLELGIYQLEPQVEVFPDRVVVESVVPSTVEVEIIIAPTPTPTLTPAPAPAATSQP